jgi:hypothetical protein
MGNLTTVPSIYEKGFFKRTATGILPFVKGGDYSTQTLTWENMKDMLFEVRENTDFQNAYLGYLAAAESGESTVPYITTMTTIMTEAASSIVGCSAFKFCNYYLLNNACQIRASSDLDSVGFFELGTCAENVVTMTQNDTIASCVRNSFQIFDANGEGLFCYYSAVSMGSFQTNSEYPAHILKIVCSYDVQDSELW